jgi:hypothetical protein
MRIHPGLLLVPALLTACDSGTPTAPPDSPLAVETLTSEFYSGFTAPRRTVVRTAGELADAWQTLYATRSPQPPLPAVDFDRTTVVVVAAGNRPTGCFAIEVTGASLRGDGAAVFEVTETVPGPTCACTQALTQPVHVVRVPRLDGAATFVEHRSEARC